MDRLRALVAWSLITAAAAIILTVIVGLVVWLGFAWALITCGAVFLIWARRFDTGTYGEKAWLVPLVGIFGAVCLVVGLVVRLVVT